MTRHRSVLVVLTAALLGGCASAVRPLAIEHVTVIDATGAPAQPDMTVIVRGSRIAAVTPSASARVPRNARVVDGSGKYLIPGLWDMHVHLSSWGQDALATVVSYGILTVRDLGSRLPEIDAWRAAVDRGERVGPHIYRAGSFIDGPKEMTPDRASMTIVVHDAEEGREAVRAQKQRGVDLIKTHNGLSREAFLAIADECRKEHVLLASHLPTRWVTAEEASDAGVSSIEHIEMLTESLVWENVPPGGKPNGVMASLEKMTDERAMEVFRRFVKNGTWYDPTLVAYRTFMQEAVELAPRKPEYQRAAAARTTIFHRFVQLVGLMHRAGVPLLAGSDFGPRPETVEYPVVHPGTDLHDELLLFVQAGLTPMEALQAATAAPARFMRAADHAGTIAVGKDADLVLLDADPLADIANTRAIAAVVLRGRLLEKRFISAAASPDSPDPGRRRAR